MLLSIFLPAKAIIASAKASGCPIPDLGKKFPVLLVHGFLGRPSIWNDTLGAGTQSMLRALSVLPNQIYVPAPFDYKIFSTRWVSDPNIGLKLANTIDSLAQASLCSGGPGKVIVVAHSMGGLAVRYAVGTVKEVNGRKLSDEIGLVITIGTPNFGSLVSDALGPVADALCAVPNMFIAVNNHVLHSNQAQCTDWSAVSSMETNLASNVGNLPLLPQSIPLMGIAGDVHGEFDAFNSTVKVSDSDTLVLTNSALVGHSQTNQGAGTLVVPCNAWWLGFYPPSDGICAHGNLTKNPDVQAQVVKSIKLYLASLQPGPTSTPISSSGPCPSVDEIKQAVTAWQTDRGLPPPSTIDIKAGPACQDNKAGAIVVTDGSQSPVILDYVNGSWVSEGDGPFMSGGGCAGLPAKLTEFFHGQGYC